MTGFSMQSKRSLMNSPDIDKAYVSPFDRFLRIFFSENPASASQLQEMNKHKKIAQKRDNKQVADPKKPIWKDF